MRNPLRLALMLLPLSACTPDQPPQTTVFDPQVEALNKAKQLEAQLQKDADNQRRAIEAAEAAPETKGY